MQFKSSTSFVITGMRAVMPCSTNMWRRLTAIGTPPRYSACDVDLKQSDPQPNNWLLSDQITVSEANRIDITVQCNIRDCSTFPNNGGHHCVNVFDLYVHQSDSDLYPDPLTNSVAYKKIAEINQTTDKAISVLIKGKHIILAFHNYGACSTLFSVKVTYNVCPDETLSNSLVSLPRTVAPANDSEPTRVEGNCDEDTVQVSGRLYVHCESNGEWNTTGLEGRCICKKDMQNNDGICKGNVVAFTILSLKS
ncbi:ephrin type-A receptor 2-like [Orbicella faveolata]|uniref:ephrin type-A receptor 2-like n=1 Tax=Orbicella faveolata TaxID=48498 RepID=UPI0009E31A31|nr:ephrin type-A receptor 2-like [Orbicella faveolata]